MTDITSKAMLVSLNISTWRASRHDKEVTAEVARRHNTSGDVGRYNKRLIAKEALADLRACVSRARSTHYNETLPWSDAGMRILPADNYFEYSKKMRAVEAEFTKAVADFVTDYPTYRNEAKVALNGLYKADEYPDPSDIENAFKWVIDVVPMPGAADFRVSLGHGEEKRIRKEITSRVNTEVNAAMKDLWSRLHETVERMVERLNAYKPKGDGHKAENPFRDTLVQNIAEVVEILPRLNVTGDKKLERMCSKISKQLLAHDAQTLRDDERARQSVTKNAEDILDAMSGYVS